MARHTKAPSPRFSPRFRVRNTGLWIVVAVALLFGLFLLTRMLSRSPAEPGAKPVLDTAKGNLEVYTRLIGTVTIDESALRPLSPELRRLLASIDTMIMRRELRDAISRMERAAKKFPPQEQAALSAYIGLCHFELANPNRALIQFEKALAAAPSTLPDLAAATAFNIGYLFMRYDQPDSALVYWTRARAILPSPLAQSTSVPSLLAPLLNNLGVASEVRGDTVQARTYYLAAARFIDTTATTDAAYRLRRNLRRVGAKESQAGQHQP